MDVLTPELEDGYLPLYEAYLVDLAAGFERVEPWWKQLLATHGRKALKLRWPAGPASHPRILAIYRDYYQRVLALGDPARHGPPPRVDDDAAWGSEVELAPGLLVPPAPERVLVDRLQIEAPRLHAKMIYLLMQPIGEQPNPRPRMEALELPRFDPRPPQSFDFGASHQVPLGIRRLLGAGIDLRPRAFETFALSEATVGHQQAFSAYQRALEQALLEAESWWGGMTARHEGRGLLPEDASAEVWADHRLGPVTHPRVLGVVQAYWVLCHEINAVTTNPKQQLAPEIMLLAWLRDGRHDSWVEVLTAMPYWPVGLDAKGAWI